MDKQALVVYWRDFFKDLFVGTLRKLFSFSLAGFAFGIAMLYILKWLQVDDLELGIWLDWLILLIGFFWYGGFGGLFGLISCVIQIATDKLKQVVEGLHRLLDLLSREVISQFPRMSKDIPREQLEETFDKFGQDFLDRLRLRGPGGIVSSLVFGVILKTLKFFFLEEVVEELRKKPSGDITSSDIENAMRRVGMNMVVTPMVENLFILHIVNCVLLLLAFGLPFGLFWWLGQP